MDIIALAIIFVAVGAGAISKGATGMGMPLIAIPFLAATFGLQHAIAVLLIPILVPTRPSSIAFGMRVAKQGWAFCSPCSCSAWLALSPERGF